MLVRVTGSKDKEFSKILKKACNFYIDQFLPKQLTRHLSVGIKFKRKLADGAEGYCDIVGFNKQGRPRKFNVEILSGQPSRHTLVILAHEMVHVKQYALCELNLGELEDERSIWRGRQMSYKLEYWDFPWEKEARRHENRLVAKFLQENSLDLI